MQETGSRSCKAEFATKVTEKLKTVRKGKASRVSCTLLKLTIDMIVEKNLSSDTKIPTSYHWSYAA